jgi:hypothetical protein
MPFSLVGGETSWVIENNLRQSVVQWHIRHESELRKFMDTYAPGQNIMGLPESWDLRDLRRG